MPVYLGIDHGTRRVGIAASDPDAAFAFAVTTHVEGRDGSLLELVAALVAERAAAGVVVGLPLTADGREGESAQRARRFAERLAAVLPVPVALWDERYTSQEADRYLPRKSGRSRERGERDAVAAELILQGWLDHRAGLAAGGDAVAATVENAAAADADGTPERDGA
ncbi:MAG: Holliday junction resolvase RuvX [bacterium]|nr:Holliday junction resolvase RuvX [bacterium]